MQLIRFFTEHTILNDKGKQLTAAKAETAEHKRKRDQGDDGDDRP
jgi:hypothetical protein